MEATLNVRMKASLKERGDKVLRDNGISTSAAVRALWQEMATTRTLPSFLQDLKEDSSAKKAQTLALDALAGVGEGTLSSLSDEEIEEIGVSRYEQNAD